MTEYRPTDNSFFKYSATIGYRYNTLMSLSVNYNMEVALKLINVHD